MAAVPRPKVFPVPGGTYTDTWGAHRATTGKHEGVDIFAPRGTPVYAIEAGTITKIGPSKIGGNRVWVNGRWYFAHLDAFAPGLKKGDRVKAGQLLGYVGTTGDAQGTPPHLHLGYSPDYSQGRKWANPIDILRQLEKGGSVPAAMPAGEATAATAPVAGAPQPSFDVPTIDFPAGPPAPGPDVVGPGTVAPGGTSGWTDLDELRETWKLWASDPYADDQVKGYASTLG